VTVEWRRNARRQLSCRQRSDVGEAMLVWEAVVDENVMLVIDMLEDELLELEVIGVDDVELEPLVVVVDDVGVV
jgi:hypothetical protein